MGEEVTWQDQQQINAFSRLNSRSIFLKSLNKSRQVIFRFSISKMELDYYKDAINEMELMEDDEPVKYKIGECFVELTVENARKRLEESISTFEKEIKKDSEEMDKLVTEMRELKTILYGKFKGSINLEYEE